MLDRAVIHHLEHDVPGRHRVGDHADRELREVDLNDRRSTSCSSRALRPVVHRNDRDDAENERRDRDRSKHQAKSHLGEEGFLVGTCGVHE